MIGPAKNHFRRQVPALLAAQRADDHDRLEWKQIDPGRDIPPAAFALDDEQLAFLDAEGHHRKPSIGEYMANVQLENVDCSRSRKWRLLTLFIICTGGGSILPLSILTEAGSSSVRGSSRLQNGFVGENQVHLWERVLGQIRLVTSFKRVQVIFREIEIIVGA